MSQFWVILVIDIGNREIATGATYVAFSRMKRITDCLIVTYTYDRYERLRKSKRLFERKKEEDRLKKLEKQNFQI